MKAFVPILIYVWQTVAVGLLLTGVSNFCYVGMDPISPEGRRSFAKAWFFVFVVWAIFGFLGWLFS